MKNLIVLFSSLVAFSSVGYSGGSHGGTPAIAIKDRLIYDVSPKEFKLKAMDAIESKPVLFNQRLMIPNSIDPIERQIILNPEDNPSSEVILQENENLKD